MAANDPSALRALLGRWAAGRRPSAGGPWVASRCSTQPTLSLQASTGYSSPTPHPGDAGPHATEHPMPAAGAIRRVPTGRWKAHGTVSQPGDRGPGHEDPPGDAPPGPPMPAASAINRAPTTRWKTRGPRGPPGGGGQPALRRSPKPERHHPRPATPADHPGAPSRAGRPATVRPAPGRSTRSIQHARFSPQVQGWAPSRLWAGIGALPPVPRPVRCHPSWRRSPSTRDLQRSASRALVPSGARALQTLRCRPRAR